MTTTYQKGASDNRPWGTWEVLETSTGYCVKKICVKPHARLSLQLHHHRAEHWIVADGQAIITIGDKKINAQKDDAVYIPVETKHRIENDSDKEMTFIEVQTGDLLDEDDIVRFEDMYGRV